MKTIVLLSIFVMAEAVYGLSAAAEIILGPDIRVVPGEKPTPWLRYKNPEATAVSVAGVWNTWSEKVPLQRDPPAFGTWIYTR